LIKEVAQSWQKDGAAQSTSSQSNDKAKKEKKNILGFGKKGKKPA
tara:strand:+ start:728 stop:862 length:135 start_codon:yes stop_codon:yes gene_type:complete